jgi:hypothetical protein
MSTHQENVGPFMCPTHPDPSTNTAPCTQQSSDCGDVVISEKELLLPRDHIQQSAQSSTASWRSKWSFKLCFVLFLGLLSLVALNLRGCSTLSQDVEVYHDEEATPAIKYERADTTTSAASTATLEVFAVYPPVLGPDGVLDSTGTEQGTSNTTTISPTEAENSCTVILMDYSFGYSYGEPFIGEFQAFFRFCQRASHGHMTEVA